LKKILEKKVFKEDDYYERHHIWPRAYGAMDDFNSQPWNVIFLSGKDHFISHKLLWLAYRDNKSSNAFNRMKSMKNGLGKRFFIENMTPSEYENLRKDLSKNMTENNPMKNEQTRQKQKNSQKKKKLTQTHKNNISLGKQKTIDKKGIDQYTSDKRKGWLAQENNKRIKRGLDPLPTDYRKKEVIKKTKEEISRERALINTKIWKSLSKKDKDKINKKRGDSVRKTYSSGLAKPRRKGHKNTEETKRKRSESLRQFHQDKKIIQILESMYCYI
jgi:hypothetical protein